MNQIDASGHVGPVTRSRWHERSRTWVAVGSVIGLIVVVTTLTTSGVAVLSHTVCATGSMLANQNFWTPFDLTNSPYRGSTIWGASFDVWGLYGPGHVVLRNGNLSNGNLSTGFFETQNWSVFGQSNQTAWGPGVSSPCKSGYIVGLAHSGLEVASDGPPLQGPGNTSNAHEPTTYSPDGRPAATFSNGFVAPNMPSISTCGRPSLALNISSTSFEATISVDISQHLVPITFSIESFENFTYHFPANGGTWEIDNLSAPNGPGGGWAFSHSPCT